MDTPTPSLAQNYINIPASKKPRVVIIGGGFAGIEFAKALDDDRFQVVLLDRHNYHTFQPLLYQVATAGLEPDSIAGPLRKILDDKEDFYFRLAQVASIDPVAKVLDSDIGRLSFDYLVIANGTKTNYFGNENIRKLSFPLKQVPHALDLRSALFQHLERAVLTHDPAERQRLLNVVIVGGGPTGVEMAGAFSELRDRVLPADYPEIDFTRMRIILVEGGAKLIGAMSEFASRKSQQYLERFKIELMLNTVVKEYDGTKVTLSNGNTLDTELLIWAAGVTGNLIDGFPADVVSRGNRLKVDQFNQVVGYPGVYALGDIAAMPTEKYPNGHPQLAPVAMQQGRNLARNLGRIRQGEQPKPFEYFDKGSMAVIGRNKAVVDLPNDWHFGGFFAWVTWLVIHLFYIIGFRNKFIVTWNWFWNYVTFDRGTRLIIRPYVRAKDPQPISSESAMAH